MRLRRGMGVFLLVAATMAAALLGTRVPEALAEVEAFRVKEVELQGDRYLTQEEVAELLDLPTETSVWDDLEPFARRIRTHGLVDSVRVRRRLPGTLVVEVKEREPVALLPTPVLTPVDRTGQELPLDPARHRLDLPILQPVREPWSEDLPLVPGQIRLLTEEVARLAESDPGLSASLSEVALGSEGHVMLRLVDPEILLRARPPLRAAHLREGLRVLADAVERRPERTPRAVDLRYRDQIVVRFGDPNGR